MDTDFEVIAPEQAQQLAKYWQDQWLIGELHEMLAEHEWYDEYST